MHRTIRIDLIIAIPTPQAGMIHNTCTKHSIEDGLWWSVGIYVCGGKWCKSFLVSVCV